MESWIQRDKIHSKALKLLLGNASEDDKKPVLPEDLSKWLAQLTLLYGIPVTYLVPDTRLLPNESMRFFFLDRNWLDRLVDGAMSIGVLSSLTGIFQEVFFEEIYKQVDIAQLNLRSRLRDEDIRDEGEAGGPITGVIFRSQVVSGWPGLEVYPIQGEKPLNILRMDRLAPDVLLCLFEGVPDEVDFVEPSEGLHFGITREKGSSSFEVSLRGLGYPSVSEFPPGEQIDSSTHGGKLRASGQLREGESQPSGVVDIEGLVASVEEKMSGVGALDGGKIHPGGFAIQLVQGAGRQKYITDIGSPYPDCVYTKQ